MRDPNTVYLITNTVNGKQYVGITNGSFRKRWREHINASENNSDTYFARAIRKYGPEKFSHEILEQCESYEEAQMFEKLYISELDTFENGYNMTEGGAGSVGFTHKEETIQKMRERTFTEGTRRKISDSSKGNQKWLGKQHTQKSKQKISSFRKTWWSRLSNEERKHHVERLRRMNKLSQQTRHIHSPEIKHQLSEQKWSLTPEQRLMVAIRFQGGEKGKDLAHEFSVSRSTIQRCAKLFEVKKRGFAQKLIDEDIGDLYFVKGMSIPSISTDYDMSIPTVGRAIVRERSRRGLSARVHGHDQLNKVRMMRESGMTYTQMSKELGVSVSTIHSRLKNLGLIRRNK